MQDLEKKLFEETQSLKEQFVEITENWAIKDFEKMDKMYNWSDEEKVRHFNYEPKVSYMGIYPPDAEGKCFYIGKDENGNIYHKEPIDYRKIVNLPSDVKREKRDKYDKFWNSIKKVVEKQGKENYIAKKKDDAIKHYENSIYKLANRIRKKGLDENNLQMGTSHIGVNIETTISDGNKTVKAWTIIAEGAVQRPHYRYLVK